MGLSQIKKVFFGFFLHGFCGENGSKSRHRNKFSTVLRIYRIIYPMCNAYTKVLYDSNKNPQKDSKRNQK